MPGGGDHGDDVDGEHPGVHQFHLDFVEGCAGVLGERDTAEALTPDVLDDVDEGDEAGDALHEVHAVAGPGVDVGVGAAAEGDEDAVSGVEGEGDEDEDPLEDADEGKGVEEEDLFGVGDGAVEGLEVGDDVLDEEGADGDDSGEGVEFAPQEGVALAGAEGVHSGLECMGLARCGGCWRCDCGHEGLLELLGWDGESELVRILDKRFGRLIIPPCRKVRQENWLCLCVYRCGCAKYVVGNDFSGVGVEG